MSQPNNQNQSIKYHWRWASLTIRSCNCFSSKYYTSSWRWASFAMKYHRRCASFAFSPCNYINSRYYVSSWRCASFAIKVSRGMSPLRHYLNVTAKEARSRSIVRVKRAVELMASLKNISYTIKHPMRLRHCNALQHIATHCNALQRTATHCNALQRTATHCKHTATHR